MNHKNKNISIIIIISTMSIMIMITASIMMMIMIKIHVSPFTVERVTDRATVLCSCKSLEYVKISLKSELFLDKKKWWYRN